MHMHDQHVVRRTIRYCWGQSHAVGAIAPHLTQCNVHSNCRWVIPSNIPVSAFGGQSLFGAFTQSIGQELSHFPTGPALGDKFW